MSKVKAAFVILHYLTYKDTVELIRSIEEKIVDCPYQIIVVDNGSDNDSGERLKACSVDKENVTILSAEKNVGFAKGNNLGIKYAVKNFAPDYVIVLNNDTLMIQDNFIEKIEEEYQCSHFDILGPMIVTPDGRCDSSPVRTAPVTKTEIEKRLKKEHLLYRIEKFRLNGVMEFAIQIKNMWKREEESKSDWNDRKEHVVLHGCCWIFSKGYFRYFDGLDESTFLYHEEEILYVKASSKGLKMVYNPELKLFHKEDRASDALLPKGHAKRMFKLRHCINSSNVLLRIYKECNNE